MTQPQTAKRGSGTIWLWPGDDTVVTASPTVICVWENQELVNTTEGLISGPWVPAIPPKTEQDLIAWFEGWLTAGKPK